MEEGGTIEGVLSGREGAFGIAAAFGDMRSPWLVTVQLPGEALAIPAQKLATLLPQLPHFERLLFRYEHALQQMAMHAMACNRFHPINERLARWLLMTQDRDGEELLTTQEYLARMLGVHRPGVTVALGALEQAGLVRRAGRGRIEVLDRAALEAASCECYRRVVDAIARVFE
jgi:CRP-like cAMP-binding protein